MRIRPLTGQVLVEILPPEKLSPGGIEIPERALTPDEHQRESLNPSPPPPWTGIVREIGKWPMLRSGLLDMPPFGIGQTVLVGRHSGVAMERFIGKQFRMVKASEVLAVLSDSV
jgi:co-chaperonin GroES (HSP10)